MGGGAGGRRKSRRAQEAEEGGPGPPPPGEKPRPERELRTPHLTLLMSFLPPSADAARSLSFRCEWIGAHVHRHLCVSLGAEAGTSTRMKWGL